MRLLQVRRDGDQEVLGDQIALLGPMPTGVTVSHSGRIFVNFPQWGDDVTATVAEVLLKPTMAA